MKNIKKNNNSLIKKNKFKFLLYKNGIKRVNDDAINKLESIFNDQINNLILKLKRELTIKGKKTLKKEDIESILEKVKKEEVGWEI